MGNDPPGQFTRVLHPRVGRHGEPPKNVIPVGRSVIVPANGSLPNIVLSPRAYRRINRALVRERFDVLHLHEPMTPIVCTAVMAWARCPIVATFHTAMIRSRAMQAASPTACCAAPRWQGRPTRSRGYVQQSQISPYRCRSTASPPSSRWRRS